MSKTSYRQSLPRCEKCGKICYPSQAKASRTARRVRDRPDLVARKAVLGVRLRTYYHGNCESWHLTSKPQVIE